MNATEGSPGGAGSGSLSQPGLHEPSSILSLPTPNQPVSVQSFDGGEGFVGSTFQLESSSITQYGSNLGDQCGMALVEPVKRKRGRPRKYGFHAARLLALSPMSSPPVQGTGSGSGSGSGARSGIGSSSIQTQKRGRGRPTGSVKKQLLASCGEFLSTSAGTDFTPHAITIRMGEDITSKIISFSQQGPRAIVILTANGVVSSVTLHNADGSTVTYEGRFEILCLSGSYVPTGNGGSHRQIGGLSISLSSSDGRVICGGVGGLLIAGSPVQLIVGSFICGDKKAKKKPKNSPATELELLVGDKQEDPSTTPPSHTFTSMASH